MLRAIARSLHPTGPEGTSRGRRRTPLPPGLDTRAIELVSSRHADPAEPDPSLESFQIEAPRTLFRRVGDTLRVSVRVTLGRT